MRACVAVIGFLATTGCFSVMPHPTRVDNAFRLGATLSVSAVSDSSSNIEDASTDVEMGALPLLDLEASIGIRDTSIGNPGFGLRLAGVAGIVASRTSPPFSHTWAKVAGGNYILIARATDRSGAVVTSAPLTIRVGSPTLYRALNLGGPAMRIDDVSFEGKGAKGVSCNGTPVEMKSELVPVPDASLAPLLKAAMVHPLGTSVSLIDIPNGSYQISLYVSHEGQPQVYDVVIAGKVVQSKVQSGASGNWQKLGPWTVESSGGLLEIAAKGGEVRFCALEVWRVAK